MKLKLYTCEKVIINKRIQKINKSGTEGNATIRLNTSEEASCECIISGIRNRLLTHLSFIYLSVTLITVLHLQFTVVELQVVWE